MPVLDASAGEHLPRDGAFAGFPVQFGTRTYGALYVAADAGHPETLALPLAEAHLLADVCGLLLHDLEQSALVDAQIHHLDVPHAPEPLTAREHEILMLICQGCSEAEAAVTLTISSATVGKHRQHIYEKLGVHNEHEARLVAYRERLVSFLT
jgi:DNA-binding CsgD family transcriptional regulator